MGTLRVYTQRLALGAIAARVIKLPELLLAYVGSGHKIKGKETTATLASSCETCNDEKEQHKARVRVARV